MEAGTEQDHGWASGQGRPDAEFFSKPRWFKPYLKVRFATGPAAPTRSPEAELNNPIGVVSCQFLHSGPDEVVQLTCSAGLAAIEWFEAEETSISEPDVAARIVAMTRQRGLCNSYHAPWLGRWDLGRHDSPGAAQKTLRDMLDRAGRLKAALMTLHLGSFPPGTDRRAALGKIVAALAAAALVAEDKGITICLENFIGGYGPTDLGTTVDDLDMVLGQVQSPAVGLNLDVGHAHITGNMDELLARFGRRLYNTHLHDNDRSTDAHLAPGQGTVDWTAVFQGLSRVGYAGPLNIEFPYVPEAYEAFIAKIRRA